MFKAWAAVADTQGWVDPSIDLQKDRRARVMRYLELADGSEDTLEGWFDAMLKGAETPKDAVAIAMVAEFLRQQVDTDFLYDAAFVLTEGDDWVTPRSPSLMLPGKYEARQDEVTLVHSAVAKSLGAVQALRGFGIDEVSATAELRRLARQAAMTLESIGSTSGMSRERFPRMRQRPSWRKNHARRE